MSENLFRFLLSELSTVRVHCRRCKVTVEVGIAELENKFKGHCCPVCKEKFGVPEVPDSYDPFRELTRLAEFFRLAKDQGAVEFTVPAPPIDRSK